MEIKGLDNNLVVQVVCFVALAFVILFGALLITVTYKTVPNNFISDKVFGPIALAFGLILDAASPDPTLVIFLTIVSILGLGKVAVDWYSRRRGNL